jgi:hypothetical protein
MRAEDFDKATIRQLQARADTCFDLAGSPLEEPKFLNPGGMPGDVGDAAKLRLLLEAQFYVAAVVRKRDEKVARRDFWLEVAVIILIGIEIILSIIGIRIAIKEGKDQATILGNIRDSTKDSATAMSAAKDSLGSLAGQQVVLLNDFNKMNGVLQDSLARTREMASLSKEQLKVIQDEQQRRLAQEAKKPKIALYFESMPINTVFDLKFKPRAETDATTDLDLMLTNDGDGIASRPMLRALVQGKDVQMAGIPGLIKAPEPEDSPSHVYTVNLENMRPQIKFLLIVTFNYPKGQKPFQVFFSIDADEISTGTPLGGVIIRPRAP